jgi:geranylgeranyl pyrophosphate synthase
MSKSTRVRYEYFNNLRETAEAVDPFVRNFIGSALANVPELRDLALGRYRFGTAQLRPAQVRWSFELAGGSDWTTIIPMCAAVESKDTGYYCLDDVFDKRGDLKTLSMLGGTFLTLANDMAQQLAERIPSERLADAVHELCRLDYNIAQGVLIEAGMHGTDEIHYLRKAECYNFWEHVFRIGANLGRAESGRVERLAAIGKQIGIAYIIANDAYEYGKEDLEDFSRGLGTLPVIWAMTHTTVAEKGILESLIGKERLSSNQKDEVRRIMVRSGAIAYGKERAWEYCAAALEMLQEFPESPARRMVEFSTSMTQRNKYYDALKQYEQTR